MNKLVNPLRFYYNNNNNFQSRCNKIFFKSKVQKNISSLAAASEKTEKNFNDKFKIETIGIKEKLKRIVKYESFVYRSFFGEIDPDYLRYPSIVTTKEESQLLTKQYRFIQENFSQFLNDIDYLKDSGFYNLNSLTETEKAYIFEAIGSSLEPKQNNNNNNNKNNSKNLITFDQLLVTDSYLECYESKKKFIKSILPLVIHNSLILNAIQLSTNDKIKKDLLSNFENLRIGFAFDEPNDSFVSVPYPYWDSVAHFDNDTADWTLNGKKSRILDDDYDKFLIYCKIRNPESSGTKVSDYGIASFLVPKEKLKIENDGTDNYGSKYMKISFKNLNISRENAEVYVDEKATSILNIKASGQLITSAILLGIIKQLMKNMIFVIDKIVPYRSLVENYTTRMTEMIYSIESMLYLTTSHYDTFQLDQIDLYLQAMIVKIMTAEYCQEMMNMTRFLFDSKHASMVVANDINDVLNVLSGFLGSSTSTRMLLATYGVRSIGNWRFDHIVKARLSRIYELHHLKSSINYFKKKMNRRFPSAMDGFNDLTKLNPSLKKTSDLLEKALEIESEVGNNILKFYGKECVKYQIDMNRFSSIAMNTFQMVSVMSRVNDSLNRNLPSSSKELTLCENICKKSYEYIKTLSDLVEGILDTSEEKRSKVIHKANVRFDGYFAKSTFDRVI